MSPRPMSDADGLRMMQRTEEARGCHHLAQACQAGADALERELECSEGESCQDRVLIRKQAEEITQLRQQRSAMEQERDEWKLKACTDHPNADRDWVCVECVETSVDQALQQATRAAFEAGIRVRSVNFRSIDEAFAAYQQPSSPRPDHGEGS